MNLNMIGKYAGAVLLASTLGACGALQQDPQCVVAKGSFATVFTPKPGQDTTLACAQLTPQRVGLEKYFSEDPSVPDTVAVRARVVGELLTNTKYRVDGDGPNQPNSVGKLTTDAPGPDNFCEVPALGATDVAMRLIADGTPQRLTYVWSNLRVYNTPEIPGTQFTADLSYTENGCTAEYSVKGIWPVVTCEKDQVVLGPDGQPVLGTDGKPKTVKVPDETKCDPRADPAAGRIRGSGINPIFPVTCHPTVRMCVLVGEVPSDKP
ncbi:hypothetical protein [Archangium sp.]|uniref:hypothetical protein n=1 Tax=Archangium sp. TaxID=1872627 RepID=UPI00286CE219|nr:hypothetical protein [Archangium sp.]